MEEKRRKKIFETTLSARSTVVKLTLSYLLSHSQYELQCNDKLGSPDKYKYVKYYCQLRANTGKRSLLCYCVFGGGAGHWGHWDC